MKRTLVLMLALGLIACAPKSSDQKSDIKARQDLMHDWGNAFGMIKDMTKNPKTFNAQELKRQSAFINDTKGEMWRYFHDDTPDNRVNELIQKTPDDFKRSADEFDELIAQLNQKAQNAASSDDIDSAVKAVKASCKSCHKTYKKL